MQSPEVKVEEEIKKALDWYGQKYKKAFEVHRRYDKLDKHFSWRLVAEIGGREYILALGMTAKIAESEQLPVMLKGILPHIKYNLTKAQAKWEPMILASQ